MVNQQLKDGRALREPALVSDQAPSGLDPSGFDPARIGVELVAVWRQAEDNHRRYSDTGDRENDIRFLTLGLTGEAGEVANFVKKRWRDGDGHDEAIRKEIADVCAYAFMLANTMGMGPRDLVGVIADKQQVFVEKMRARDSDGSPSGRDAQRLDGEAATARAEGIANDLEQGPNP